MSEAKKPYLVLVGIDYSPVSDLALERAFEIAAQHVGPAEVHVVNVVQTLGAVAQLESPIDPGFVNVRLSDAAEQVRAHAEARLVQFRSLAAGGANHFTLIAHLRLEAAADEIAKLASDLQADLVVVGTHGRRGVSRWLLGSVAEGVVRLAPCPVLVMREKGLPVVDDGPQIEPPCEQCVAARRASGGSQWWCSQHSERHGHRHTYHQADRMGEETNLPLTFSRH